MEGEEKIQKKINRINKIKALRKHDRKEKLKIPDEKLEEYDTGADRLEPGKAKTVVARKRLVKKKGRFIERVERTARTEILNTLEGGRPTDGAEESKTDVIEQKGQIRKKNKPSKAERIRRRNRLNKTKDTEKEGPIRPSKAKGVQRDPVRTEGVVEKENPIRKKRNRPSKAEGIEKKGMQEKSSIRKKKMKRQPKSPHQHIAPLPRRDRPDQFPEKLEIPPEKLQEYDTGADRLEPGKAKTVVARKRLVKKKGRFIERVERTARTEILNTLEGGYIEPDKGVPTYFTSQTDICEAVDVASATKHFELDLRFGPYRIDYTQNGRFALLGGRKGHVAAFDWMTKDLVCEMNVMESVRDVQWLHVETMYAVAQKRWLRIYDRAGTELHCIKGMFDIKRLEFLPRHFLLVGSGGNSFLTWLDVSVGKEVASFPTGHGTLDVLTQNPANAIIVAGDSRGTVSMWSPNSKKPLVEMFTHRGPVLGIAVDQRGGTLMATTGLDNRMRIWDLRNSYTELCSYAGENAHFGQLAFSQRNCLAVAADQTVQIYNDAHLGKASRPYLMHRCEGQVADLRFCPYEDVLGVGHSRGIISLLVPGAGDSNFDALRANPFESKKQRQEREVRMLLDKLQPELITLNPGDINKVNRGGLKRVSDYKRDVMHIKPDSIEDAGEEEVGI